MTGIDALLQAGRIGPMVLRNRLVMAAMGGVSTSETENGGNQRAIDFYAERARGGAGLVIAPSIVSTAANMPGAVAPDPARTFRRLKGIATAVREKGAKFACQLGYVTLVSWPGVLQVGPSAVPSFSHKLTPRALTVGEIGEIASAWAEAAARAREAEIDAVEVQAAHGFFLSAFLSSFLNRREDQYGGSLENRARFACEVIGRVRQAVGRDYPLLVRLNGSDFIEGGLTLEESKMAASLFVKAGADAIDVSAGTQDSRQWRDLSYFYPDAALVPLAEAIKKAVPVPVIAAGKIGRLELADRIIAEGKADFVGMARGLLADPALLEKTLRGNESQIHGCIYCNNCRLERTGPDGQRKRGLACTVNPALAREREFALVPAHKAKKVIVVGGGLAGMEAACSLAERGHQVTLYEKSAQLGGQWNIACKLPHRSDFHTLLPYLKRRLERCGARVLLNQEVTAALVKEQEPAAVVVATGAVPISPDIPGADGEQVWQAVEVISRRPSLGSRIVVLGGRLRAMETAELLADSGKKVSLVTRGRLGGSAETPERNIFVTLRDRLIAQGVGLFSNAPVFEINPQGVYAVLEGELQFFPADSVVLALGARPVDALFTELKGVAPEVFAIGDCARPRDAREAINEGAEIARLI